MALSAIVLGGLFYFESLLLSPRSLGQQIFHALTGLGLAYCLLSGRRSTADCLSQEKREGTLGLLFLTDLRGYDIVLGKLAANSLRAFYGLLAVVPVLAVPLLLGGISNAEFWRVVLVLVSTFMFALATGIFVSALSYDFRKAMGANLSLLLFFLLVLPVFAALIADALPSHRFVQELFFACPIYTLVLANDKLYATSKWGFWGSSATLVLLTLLFLALASWIVPHSWQDKAAAKPRLSLPARWRLWLAGRSERQRAFRSRLLNANPFLWLAARERYKPAQVWIVLALLTGLWAWSSLKFGDVWRGDVMNPLNVTMAVLLNATLKLWVAIEAGRQIAEDHRSGAFELLLSTPLRVNQILRGQWLALRRQFLGPVLFVVALEFAFLVAGLRAPAGTVQEVISRYEPRPLSTWTASIGILLTDLVALGWVAMAAALTSRNANQATVRTVAAVLILPWVAVWLAGMAAVAYARAYRMLMPGWYWYLGCWFGAGLVSDLLFGIYARYQLTRKFRQLAARPLTHRGAGWWRTGGS